MDFKSLQLFQHLASSLHFAQTAKAMHISPSALSRAIQRIEAECQVAVFQRTNKSVKLTPAGQALLTFCQQMLPQWAQLKNQLATDAKVLAGELTLFCSVTASYSHLPALLDHFRLQFPQVELKIITGDPAQAEHNVLHKITDCAIAIHSADFSPKLHFQLISTLPLCLISSTQSTFETLEQIDWQQAQLVLPQSGAAQNTVLNWFAKQDIKPNVYATVAGNEAIVSMVALNCGLAIVPEIVLQHSIVKHKVNRIPLSDIAPYKLGLCCLHSRKNELVLKALLGSAVQQH